MPLIPSILRSKDLMTLSFPTYVVINRLCHSINFIHIFLREIMYLLFQDQQQHLLTSNHASVEVQKKVFP